MKSLKWLLSIVLLGSSYLFAQVENEDYVQSMLDERKLKNEEFLDKKQSPLTEDAIMTFKELKYFAPDATYKVTAELERLSSPDTIKMKTTTERLPLYLTYGKATFTLDGKEQSLTIYQNVGLMQKPGYEDYLFVPFTDETNGEQSYGGGRYIDARIGSDDSIVLDFNKAYNPYCAYNKKYSCPIPPRENHIDVEVRAGELKYK